MRLTVAMVIGAVVIGASAPTVPASESIRTIAISAKEFSFTPTSLTLKTGQRVALRITDKGKMDHEFLSTLFGAAKDVEIKAEGVKVEADEVEEVEFEPDHTVIIELTPTKAGTYTFWCAEKTSGKLHRDLGMKGTISVRP
jgi:uncharacterized cupredoxin-like copper-binding protein